MLAKPPVRKLAKDLGVDLDTVTPTGPGGIVTREDVLARAQENQPQTLATYPADDSPGSRRAPCPRTGGQPACR